MIYEFRTVALDFRFKLGHQNFPVVNLWDSRNGKEFLDPCMKSLKQCSSLVCPVRTKAKKES